MLYIHRLKNMKKGKLVALFLSIILFFGTLISLIPNFSFEHSVSVSSNTAKSIYLYNDFNYDNYVTNYIDSLSYEDTNITDKSLKNVKTLVIDAKEIEDNNLLKYCINLETLTITNYQDLSVKNINYLKNLKNLRKLTIYVDSNYVLSNFDYKIDLSNLEKVDIYLSCNLVSEIDAYIAYNLVKENYDLNNVHFMNDISYKEIEKWDQKIGIIINNLNVQNATTEEKIIKVANYITNNLKYDREIYYNIVNNTNKNLTNKIHNYNVKLLSSVLDSNDNVIEVICCNYAALANILLYKLNVETYYLIGTINNNAHAWNLVNIDNNNYFIDFTSLDSFNYLPDNLLISNTDATYNLYNNYSLPNEEQEEVVYYNTTSKLVIKYNDKVIN